jgi:hypothetical protein
MAAADGPLLLGVPARLDRRLRLGPFASGREALRALLYLAAGAVVSTVVSPFGGVPIAGFGLLTVAWRPGGESLDERVATVTAWVARQFASGGSMIARGVPEPLRRAWIAVGHRSAAAIVRAGGVPLAFLPPIGLRRKFDEFRELLTASGGHLAFFSTAAPIHATALLPGAPSPGGPEGVAREGYRELVELIARRRSVRQVYVAVGGEGVGAPALLRLESEVSGTFQRLVALGARPGRLRGRGLRAGADRMGLTVTEGTR